MSFSLYQSLRTVPAELQEAAEVFQLSAWQRFWRLELPYAMPGLLWNMMMSMSGGWFFVVASEAISVSHQSIKLPGIGSYIALAIESQNLAAVGWAIAAMLIGILLYDQLFFRPLLAWADKFRFEENESEAAPQSWLLSWLRRTERTQGIARTLVRLLESSLVMLRRSYDGTSVRASPRPPSTVSERVWDAVIAAATFYAVWVLAHFIHTEVGWAEVGHVFLLGFYTLIRVVLLICLAAIIWVPIGVWVGMNPRISGRLQAVAQFLAAFPANLFFPIAVMMIVRFELNPDIWLSPLMILGTQWYLLFNVIAGASTVPTELRYAAHNLGLTRLAALAPLSVAGHLSQFCHRRHHRDRRFMERQHRRRVCQLGPHHAAGARHRQLYRRDDCPGRLPPHCPGHLHHVHFRHGPQPLSMAPSLSNVSRPHAFLGRRNRETEWQPRSSNSRQWANPSAPAAAWPARCWTM